MMRVMSNDEELRSRRAKFTELRKGALFSIYHLQSNRSRIEFYVCVKKVSKHTALCVQIKPRNISRDIPTRSRYVHFDNMFCLNIHIS